MNRLGLDNDGIDGLSLYGWLRVRFAWIALILAIAALAEGAYTLMLGHHALLYEAAPVCSGSAMGDCRARIRVGIERSSAHGDRGGREYYPPGFVVEFPGGTVAVVNRGGDRTLPGDEAIAEFWHQEVTALQSPDGKEVVFTQYDPRVRFDAARGLLAYMSIAVFVAFSGWVFSAIRALAVR